MTPPVPVLTAARQGTAACVYCPLPGYSPRRGGAESFLFWVSSLPAVASLVPHCGRPPPLPAALPGPGCHCGGGETQQQQQDEGCGVRWAAAGPALAGQVMPVVWRPGSTTVQQQQLYTAVRHQAVQPGPPLTFPRLPASAGTLSGGRKAGLTCSCSRQFRCGRCYRLLPRPA